MNPRRAKLRCGWGLLLVSALASVVSAAAPPPAKPVDRSVLAFLVARAVSSCCTSRPGATVLIVSSVAMANEATDLEQKLKKALQGSGVVVTLRLLPGGNNDMSLVRQSATRGVVSIVGYELSPDVIRIVAWIGEERRILTISTYEEDLGMVSLGLSRRLPAQFLYQSPVKLAKEQVKLQMKFDELRSEQNSDAIKAERHHAAALKLLGGLPLRLPAQDKILNAVRNLQRAMYYSPKEQFLPRTSEHYLPHFQLGRAFYYLGNCDAAVLELEESRGQGYVSKRPESTELNLLLQKCGR